MPLTPIRSVLLALALPRAALAISSMTFEYGHDKSAQDGETNLVLLNEQSLTNVVPFTHHAYVVSDASAENLPVEHAGGQHDVPPGLCGGNPDACEPGELYAHQDGALFIGMTGGRRVVPLLLAELRQREWAHRSLGEQEDKVGTRIERTARAGPRGREIETG